MKTSEIIRYLSVLFIGAFVSFYITYQCSRPHEIFKVHTDTIPGDSIPYEVIRTKPVPVNHYIDTGKIHLIFLKPDTAEMIKLIKLYYTRNIYRDTLKNDTSALVIISDTVFMNELQKRLLIFQNRRYMVINTYMPADKPRNRLFIGAIVGGNAKKFDFGPSALFVTKKSIAFGYQYEILDKRHFVTLYWTPFKAVK